MRIALNGWFFAHHPHTGTGQYLRALLEQLPRVAPQHTYTLVAPSPPSAAPVWPEGCRRLEVPCGASDLEKVWFEQYLFPRACRALGAELGHVPHWAPPLGDRGIPFAVTLHDLIPRLLPEYRGRLPARAYTALVSAATRGAAMVLADSEASRRDILRELGLPEKRVCTVYLAADARYSPAADRSADTAARQRLGLPERYVLYLGGFDKRKNVPVLLEAWAGAALGQWGTLALAGQVPKPDGRLFADYRELVSRLDLETTVKFIGAVEEADKPALYRGAAAFVYPSMYEGFGLPPLEAMACGTPVVTTRSASLAEVVGEAARVVPPGDAPALGAALRACLTDPTAAGALRERGLAQARRFSWEKTARETAAAYEAAAR